MDASKKEAIRRYLIALIVFAALISAFAGGIGFYIAGFLLAVAAERIFAWGWTEGIKVAKSNKQSPEH